MPLPYRLRRWSARFGVGLFLAGVVLCGVAGAGAEPPDRMQEYVVDSSGALQQADLDRVRGAVDDLYADYRVRLWVYYVGDFAEMEPQQWARRAAAQSDFGDRDLLLAVATRDRSYGVSGELPEGVSESEFDDVLLDAVEPALRQNRWADAGVAAAEGVGTAAAGSAVSLAPVLIIGGAIVLTVFALMLFSRKRRSDRDVAEREHARKIDPTDSRRLAGFSLDTLDTLSQEMLIDVDNALQASNEELALATGEFGDVAVLPFRRALDQARAASSRAFAIRQQLDDDIAETPPEQRAMLLDLISTVGRADRELDSQVTQFDNMRNLLINAGDRLDALTRDLVEVSSRTAAAETELTRLRTEYPPGTLASVRDNVVMARERITFAEHTIDSGREALDRPVGEQGGAVAAIRTAESALGQARTLLDGVLHAATNIEQARAGLPAMLNELRDDLAAAADAKRHGGQELATATARAREVLDNAESATDPLATFHDAVSADEELDRALAAATHRKLAAEDLRRRLDQTLTDARVRVHTATDFIGTRRGGIDAGPRTRLAEAQRHLDEAHRLLDTDPAQALSQARTAADLAGRALHEAETSVVRWERGGSTFGPGQTGAVLGGILIGELFRGTGGGFGSGFGPQSFGGSAGSRRINRGGRF